MNIWLLLLFKDTHLFVLSDLTKPSLAQELRQNVQERVEGYRKWPCWVIVELGYPASE